MSFKGSFEPCVRAVLRETPSVKDYVMYGQVERSLNDPG